MSTGAERARTADLLVANQALSPPKTDLTLSKTLIASGGSITSSIPDPIDPELTAIIEAWPRLPQPIRAGVLAIVRASNLGTGEVSGVIHTEPGQVVIGPVPVFGANEKTKIGQTLPF